MIRYNISKWGFFFIALWMIFSFLYAGESLARIKKNTSSIEKKVFLFFDKDKNGKLNPYERGLFRTYQTFGWELADTKKKREFDFNGDSFLEPFEWEQYQKKHRIKNRKIHFVVTR